MKTLNLAIIILISTTMVTAQDLSKTEVPEIILSKFQQKYSNATDVEWEKDAAFYKVEFDQKKDEYEIWYNSDGSMVKLEKEIHHKLLPQAVLNTIKSNYPSYSIDDSKMINENDGKSYKVELEKGMQEIELFFSESGKVIREVTE